MKTRRVTMFAMYLGLCLILSYIDSLIPFFPMIPGLKLGLANLMILFVLMNYGASSAALLSFIRVFIMSVLFSNGVTALYSFAGAFLSLLMMVIVKKTDFLDIYGISIVGAISHHAGQIGCAMILLGTDKVLYYFPWLMIMSLLTGAAIAYLSVLFTKRVSRLL